MVVRQKTRLVAGDNIVKATDTIMYASVVSRGMVRITLMINALNDHEGR